MYILENESLKVKISPKGAELQSILDKNGREWLWQSDPKVWAGQAPLLFPVIGRLADGVYRHNGKEFSIPKHGFARDMGFSMVNHSETSLTLRVESNPETLEMYPFPFMLEIQYDLTGQQLKKSHRVWNKGEETMFYEIGGHDAYRLSFSPEEEMDSCHFALEEEGVEVSVWDFDENVMLIPDKKKIPLKQGLLPVKPFVHGLDCFILDELKQTYVKLLDGKGDCRLRMDFPEFPMVTLWTTDAVENSGYVCIEPWTTLPDGVFMGRELKEKQGICALETGEMQELSFTSTFYL